MTAPRPGRAGGRAGPGPPVVAPGRGGAAALLRRGALAGSVRHPLGRDRSQAAGPVGPSRAWVGPVVADLPPADRPVAQFALLTALASYQVTPPVVDELRRQHRDDRSLIEIAAWASLAAARRAAAP